MTNTPENTENNEMSREQLEELYKTLDEELYAYSFYDIKAAQFDTPFFAKSDLFARRHFTMVCEKEQLFKTFTEDFDLYRIGTFYPLKGTFSADLKLVMKGAQTTK